MAVVTMKQLLEAGVHFGHQTRRWNPKMKRFIHGERSGIHIVDLHQTLDHLRRAYVFIRDLVADGGVVMFVGTKKQAQDSIQSYAERCNMPYVNERWQGGMLTNFHTIAKRISKMKEYQRMRASGEMDAMPKKEALHYGRELAKLERNLGGIRDMEKQPDAVFILDTKKEHIAVTEARKLGVPIVAVVDTNCDPDLVDYAIPGNDDAIRSGQLMSRVVSDAVQEGRFIYSKRREASETQARSALEEAEAAEEQARARAEAAEAAAEREARVAAAVAVEAESSPEVVPAAEVPEEPSAVESESSPEVPPAAEAESSPEVVPAAEVPEEPSAVESESSAEGSSAVKSEVVPAAEVPEESSAVESESSPEVVPAAEVPEESSAVEAESSPEVVPAAEVPVPETVAAAPGAEG